MISTDKRSFRWGRGVCGGGALVLLLLVFCSFGLGSAATPGQSLPAGVALLTPRPGATIVARNPETHLVLRQSMNGGGARPWLEVNGKKIEATVAEELQADRYLHFRLPLKPDMNSVTIGPGGHRIEFRYQPLRANLNLDALGKDVYLFHQDEKLPPACAECHDLQKTKTLQPSGLVANVSCAECHQNVIEKAAWQHSTTTTNQCLACHQRFVKPWRIGFPAADIEETCYACHTGKKAWNSRKFIHGPLKVGGCTLCHNPHGDQNRYQLWADGKVALCIACHDDKSNLVSKEKPLPFVHGIINGMGCTACHDPHAGEYQYMVRKPINELCVSCHTGFAGITRGHPVGGHPVSGPKERRRPNRELNCTSCHDPHGSKFKFLLIGDSMGGRVCIACHR